MLICCYLVVTLLCMDFNFLFLGSTSGMVVAGKKEKRLSMGEEEKAVKPLE